MDTILPSLFYGVFGVLAFLAVFTPVGNILFLVPGHFLLRWYWRITKNDKAEKKLDSDGELSVLVGIALWASVMGAVHVTWVVLH